MLLRFMKRCCRSLLFRYSKLIRKIYRGRVNKKLKNHDFTIICNNCIGTYIYYDLNHRFCSPTINLLFYHPEEFIHFVKNLKEYLACEVIEIESSKKYPVGILTYNSIDVELHFMHNKSFEEAKQRWNDRLIRMNYDNIYVIMESGNDTSEKLLNDFSTISYPNKVIITNGEYSSKESLEMNIYDENHMLGDILKYKNKFHYKRVLDEFDYISFLNTGEIKRAK